MQHYTPSATCGLLADNMRTTPPDDDQIHRRNKAIHFIRINRELSGWKGLNTQNKGQNSELKQKKKKKTQVGGGTIFFLFLPTIYTINFYWYKVPVKMSQKIDDLKE